MADTARDAAQSTIHDRIGALTAPLTTSVTPELTADGVRPAFGAGIGAHVDTPPHLNRSVRKPDRRSLLSMQRSIGNAAVGRLVQRSIASIQRAPSLNASDYTTIAAAVHDAMEGWGTDEEAIYAALRKLQNDAAAITALKSAYKTAYTSDIEDDIKDEMSGSELDYALGLLKAGGGTAAASSEAEFKSSAKSLHEAMAGWGTDEEAIYAALSPFNRDAAKLTTLKTTYKSEYSSELEADIRDEMSSDELQYALYLLNGTPPGTPSSSTTVNAPGTEQHKGKTPGGEVSVHTGGDMTAGGTNYPDTFSVGYEGGLAEDSGWIQFIWSEVIATKADGTETTVNATGLGSTNGTMDLTTDPSSPSYKVDTASKTSPFYEARGTNIRTSTGTTMYDRPSAFSDIIERQFDGGATKVVERDHFDEFLVQGYKTIYHTSVTVQWIYTSKTAVARSTSAGAAGKVTGMPSGFRTQLLSEFSGFDYIQ